MTDLSDYYREMIQRADDALAIGIPSVARRILREALIPQVTLTVNGEELKTWDQVREEQEPRCEGCAARDACCTWECPEHGRGND